MNDELKERVKALAVEAGFGIVHSEAAGQLFERFAQAVARDCAASWQAAHGFDKHGVAGAIRARYGLAS